MRTTIVVGAGPAGLVSAYFRAINGDDVILIEKNEKAGKKLYITGKGRCNVTNDCDRETFLDNVVTNARFMRGAISKFPPSAIIDFLQKKVDLKTERGNRVFPTSDKASDITKALVSYCAEAGVKIHYGETVGEIISRDGKITKAITDKGEYVCDAVIVCTGGMSYSSTGSTGDGYRFAKSLGHKITAIKPALCGFNLKGDFFKKLQGISLKNVTFTAKINGKKVYGDFGEALFTHFGISGPVVISASSYLNKVNLNDVVFSIDLKPALSEEQLDARLLRDFEKYKGKTLSNSLVDLLLHAFIPVILDKAGISGNIKTSDLKKSDRLKIVRTVKNFEFYPASLRGIEEAIVTSGGVDVIDVDPTTMESKLVKGLYFAGEVLDVDALTGGFNITVAMATGYVAGNAKEKE